LKLKDQSIVYDYDTDNIVLDLFKRRMQCHLDQVVFQGWENFCYWIGFLIGYKESLVLVAAVRAQGLDADFLCC
jgi:hypothetical protein